MFSVSETANFAARIASMSIEEARIFIDSLDHQINPRVFVILSFAETGHNPKSFMKIGIEVLRNNYNMTDLYTDPLSKMLSSSHVSSRGLLSAVRQFGIQSLRKYCLKQNSPSANFEFQTEFQTVCA